MAWSTEAPATSELLSNAELARRMGTSAAYVIKLFWGNANMSLQTMAKLALAIGARVHLGLVEK